MNKEEIDKLNVEIRKLKRELRLTKAKYKIELKNNGTLIFANTKLLDENKWLKRDVARIKEVFKYISSCKDNKEPCNIKIICSILDGTNKDDNLDNYIDV